MNEELKWGKTAIFIFILYMFIGFVVYFYTLITPHSLDKLIEWHEFLFTDNIENIIALYNKSKVDVIISKVIFIYSLYGIFVLSIFFLFFYIVNRKYEHFKPIKQKRIIVVSFFCYFLMSSIHLMGYFYSGIFYKMDRALWSAGLFSSLFIVFVSGVIGFFSITVYQAIYSIIGLITNRERE
ncbi:MULTISPECIES: hypothetical protein [Gallibacterium]|uniref:Uncharacterized protein n=2 Tax=Gallibacterium TaxID=155493 RepID=A0A1A7PXT7_9PAST|nr:MULTISPECIES: hypothetical protein [Gallibacterium]OBW98250.1 hypothetical protein QV03_07635 [Gallibacterium anatis]OBX07393.1 hypothetical protein QV07_07180 [Gallibacterium genomosp. 3]